MSYINRFSTFYFDDSLAGHFLLTPSIFVGKSVKKVFSSTTPLKGKELAWELATRIFLSILCLIIVLPSALLIPFGLAIKGLSSCCCHSNLPERAPLLSSPPQIIIQKKLERSGGEKAVEKETKTSFSECSVKQVPRDGNCLFTCFLEGTQESISVTDLRGKVSDWIGNRFIDWKKNNLQDPAFETHLKASLDCYLQQRKEFLSLEESQVSHGLDGSPEETQHCAKRLQEIPNERERLEAYEESLKNSKGPSEIEALTFDFLEKMRSSDPERLYHARAIQLYALSELFSVKIEVYFPLKTKQKYNLSHTFDPKSSKKTIFCLLDELHYDLLIKN